MPGTEKVGRQKWGERNGEDILRDRNLGNKITKGS